MSGTTKMTVEGGAKVFLRSLCHALPSHAIFHQAAAGKQSLLSLNSTDTI